MGGVTRRSLLASLMALSLLCGGLGVAEAAVVHVNEVAGGTSAVYTTDETYTKTETDGKLALKADATDVATNTANINNLDGKLSNLTTTVNGKADAANVYTRTEADGKLALKANAADVNTELTKKADKATTLAGYGITDAYTKADVDNAVAGAVTTAGTNVDAKLADYAKTADVDTKLAGKADKATTLAGYGITDAYTKGEVAAKLNTKANQTDLTQAMDRITANEAAITGLTTKTTEISYAAGDGTKISGVTIKDGNIVGNGNSAITGLTNVATGSINGKSLAGTTVATEKDVSDAVKVETDARTAADTVLEGKINDEKAAREAEDTNLSNRIGTVTEDGTYIKKSATNNVSENLKVLDTQAKTNAEAIAKETADRRAAIGELAVDGNYIEKDKNVSDNLVKLDNQAKANADAITETNQRTHGITRDDTRNETSIEGKVTVDTNGNIKAEGTITSNGLNAGSGEITTSGKVSAGDVSTGTLETTGDATIGGTLNTKDVTAETIYVSKSEDTPVYKSEGKIIGEGGNLSVSNEKFYKSTNITKKSQLNVNEEGTVNWATSTDATGNVTEGRSEVTADNIKNSVKKTEGGTTFGYEENITADGKVGTVTDKEGNTSSTRQDSKGIYGYAKDKDGNKSYTKQEGNRIAESVIGQDGKQTKSEMTSTDITNTAKDGTITNTAKNVTNEGTESVTNKVGANEVKVSTNGVDITAEAGKKITESVGTASRVVENDKITDKAADSTVTTENGKGTTFGKEGSTGTTNIYGDSIKTGTINAEDTTTAKLTAGAAAGADGGRLTVDADGVQGAYKSGKYTSKSYILANTLKSGVDNGKKPTDTDFVGSRTDHYMDGDKAKLDETVKDADGSNVTNKTSTGTVTTITDGTNTSIIDQKKDSITSAVGDGTTSTVIKQDKDNVTIASSAGTVGIAGKDIINAATDTITNTAGTKITDTAGDSSVTTENGKGTTFTNTGANIAIGEGTVTDTTIKGNTITTGKVTMDYAEVMKDLGVGGNANIGGKTTTGSLEVTGISKLTGDVTMENNATVGRNLTVNGITTTKTLKVTENAEVDGELKVAKKATFEDSVAIAKDLSVGGDVTAKSYKVGDKTYISAAGINANDQKITNVADGSISEGSKDAVNGGQLYGVKRDLEHQVDKVGANAAAMANLRPMEFDPDSKWNIAAAIGNYGSETAAALGAFYRPNDDVMVNLSTAFGTGENMVGGGVSVRLGKGGNKLSREETNALKAQVADLTARMDALLSVLNPNMSKDFPDVPENHWAYEAVSRLAGNDIVQGYPDGEFHGERTMTRYEMAEIIYNALSRGAEAEKELVEEFKPELQAMAASEKATAERAEG